MKVLGGHGWLDALRDVDALLEGHFVLSSGLHSREYVQCARLLQHPDRVAEAAKAMVEGLGADIEGSPESVAAPAMGGIVVGYEVARAWGCRSIWAERAAGGSLAFRRGFSLGRGERVVVVEDVVTTAGSVRELIDLCRASGAVVVGAAVLVDRSGGSVNWDVPVVSLVQLAGEQWEPASCPLCREGVPTMRPGSRPEMGTKGRS